MRNILFTCLNRSFRTPGIVWLSSLQQLNDQTNFLEDTEVWVFHTPDFNKSGYEKFTFVRWYELHLQNGGEPDPVMAHSFNEVLAEEKAGQSFSYPAGKA